MDRRRNGADQETERKISRDGDGDMERWDDKEVERGGEGE